MIILKKDAQPLLDAAGLNELSIRVGQESTSNPVAVTTECGVYIGVVQGILVPRKLSNTERKYTLELISKYIEKYEKELHESLQAHKDLKKLKKEPSLPENMGEKYGRVSYNTGELQHFGVEKNGNVHVNATKSREELLRLLSSQGMDILIKTTRQHYDVVDAKVKLINIINKTVTCKL